VESGGSGRQNPGPRKEVVEHERLQFSPALLFYRVFHLDGVIVAFLVIGSVCGKGRLVGKIIDPPDAKTDPVKAGLHRLNDTFRNPKLYQEYNLNKALSEKLGNVSCSHRQTKLW